MKKILACAVISILLSACAEVPRSRPEILELQRYASIVKPQAENGSMKWSAYYEGLYQRQMAAGAPGEVLSMVNDIWRAAQRYESGAISKEEFEYQQRAVRARGDMMMAQAKQAEQARQAQQTAAILALRANIPQPTPYQIIQPPPLQMAPVAPIQPLAAMPTAGTVSAFWTGKQQQVQTVTNQVGWNCEYNYAGQIFWRTFTGTCPSSVQVR